MPTTGRALVPGAGAGRRGSSASRCVARANDGSGIDGSIACIVKECIAEFNQAHGIEVSDDSYVLNNVCRYNGNGGDGAGVDAANDCRVEGNLVGNNDWGIHADNSHAVIIRNTASGNTENYHVTAANSMGAVINISTGGSFSTDRPWANFVH